MQTPATMTAAGAKRQGFGRLGMAGATGIRAVVVAFAMMRSRSRARANRPCPTVILHNHVDGKAVGSPSPGFDRIRRRRPSRGVRKPRANSAGGFSTSRRLTWNGLLPISPLTLGPVVRRTFCCVAKCPKSSCCIVTESRRAALRGIEKNEAYLSTVQTRPQAPARISCSHGHQGWSRRGCSPPQPGPQAAVRLSGRPERCRAPSLHSRVPPRACASAPNFLPSGAVKSAAGGFFCWKS